jgi:ADP-heptose:LPS heptosyltransferase
LNIEFQRKVDRWAGSLICRIFSLFPGKDKKAAGLEPERILVILLSEMGSLILANSMFKELKRRYPQASIYALLFERNREILELVNVMPPENILTINDRSMVHFAQDSLNIIRKMRGLRFDTVIDCELFSRVSSIFSYLSGAGIRVGFHRFTQEGLYRGDFINRPVLYNPYLHIGRQFLGMVEAVQSGTVPAGKRSTTGGELSAPRVDFPEVELQNMRAKLHRDFPGIRDRNLVLLYPGGGLLPVRAWPIEYYGRLSADLLKEGYAVAIIGLEEDKKLARTILSFCQDSRCVDLTGYTKSICELLMIFHISKLLITNDGGPGHFSATTQIPAIVLYGPDTPVLYGSLNQRAHHFFLSLSCSPCLTAFNHRNSPCDGDNRCLKLIAPEKVFAKAIEILKGSS